MVLVDEMHVSGGVPDAARTSPPALRQAQARTGISSGYNHKRMDDDKDTLIIGGFEERPRDDIEQALRTLLEQCQIQAVNVWCPQK